MADDLALLEESDLMQAYWYAARYGDVAIMGQSPARHYLLHGAALGRDPGPDFSTRAYLSTYQDVAASRMNPLVHYLRYGKEEGRDPVPGRQDGAVRGDLSVAPHRQGLYVQGHGAGVLARLHAAADGTDRTGGANDPYVQAFAARELALWFLRGADKRDPERALSHVEQALNVWAGLSDQSDTGQRFLNSLGVLQLVCRAACKHAPAEDVARAQGHGGADLLLARSHFETSPQARLVWINRALESFGRPALHLLATEEAIPAFDRLTSRATAAPVQDQEAPRVSVLIAAYNAQDTLPAALRSLCAQSWRNLEILVIDDASTDKTARVVTEAAARDARIRLVQLPRNGGAYVARNTGLDAATGDFVTLHDADDWAHPDRIALQVAHLQESGDFGCCSEQMRVQPDLAVSRLSPEATFILENTASYMFRRAPMRDRFGYWDAVRVSADSELIRRARRVFGAGGARSLRTGPVVLQRDTGTSAVRDPVLGINGYAYGARRDYREAQMHFHARVRDEAGLKYAAGGPGAPGARPFPAPAILVSGHRKTTKAVPSGESSELVLAGDFRPVDAAGLAAPVSLWGVMQRLQEAVRAGLPGPSMAMVQYDYDDPVRALHDLHPGLRDAVRRLSVRMLTYGETLRCTTFELHDPGVVAQRQRYLPQIIPQTVRVVAHHPPRVQAGPGGGGSYDPARCDAVLRDLFGVAPVWVPKSAGILTALQQAAPDLELAPVGGVGT